MFRCDICEKDFESKMAYFGHKRVHTSKGRAFEQPSYIKHPITGEVITEKQLDNYNKNLSKCESCENVFHKKEKDQKYCSLSCAGKTNREKQMKTLKFKVPNTYRRIKLIIIKSLVSYFTMNRKKYENMVDTIQMKHDLFQALLNDFPRIWLFRVIEPFLKLMLFTKPSARLIFILITILSIFLLIFSFGCFLINLI